MCIISFRAEVPIEGAAPPPLPKGNEMHKNQFKTKANLFSYPFYIILLFHI